MTNHRSQSLGGGRDPDLRSPGGGRRAWALCVAFGLLVVAWPTLAAEIVDVRVGRHPDFTRVVFELDRAVGYRIERADSSRGVSELVVSLEAVSSAERIDSPKSLIQQVRLEPVGARSVARVRLVKGGLRIKEMILNNPPRIVLDVLNDVPATKVAARKSSKSSTASKKATSTAQSATKSAAKQREEAAEKKLAQAAQTAKQAKESAREREKAERAAKRARAEADAKQAELERAARKRLADSKAAAGSAASKLRDETTKAADATADAAKTAAGAAASKLADTKDDAKAAVGDSIAKAERAAREAGDAAAKAGKAAEDSLRDGTKALVGDDAALARADQEKEAETGAADARARAADDASARLADAARAKERRSAADAEKRVKQAKPATPPPMVARTDRSQSDSGWLTWALAGVAAIALVAGGLFVARRRAGGEVDFPDEAGEFDAAGDGASNAAGESGLFGDLGNDGEQMTLDGGGGSAASASATDRAASTVVVPDEEKESESVVFGDSDLPNEEKDMDDMEVISREQVNESLGGAMPPAMAAVPEEFQQMMAEMTRRMEALESRCDELVDARDRLERQVAAQTEELRVQRAAIARTQRAVRNLGRPEEEEQEPTEPALRDPNQPSPE